jgi:hypothetical protein
MENTTEIAATSAREIVWAGIELSKGVFSRSMWSMLRTGGGSPVPGPGLVWPVASRLIGIEACGMTHY